MIWCFLGLVLWCGFGMNRGFIICVEQNSVEVLVG